ncbi:hypothetical protein LINPERHAP2_LOCUS35628 [Linum perenne]
MLALGELLAPRNAFRVHLGYAHYLIGSFEQNGTYNWGQHIMDNLLSGLVDLKKSKRTSYPAGDMNFVVVSLWFLGLLISNAYALITLINPDLTWLVHVTPQLHLLDLTFIVEIRAVERPTCLFWHDGHIESIISELRQPDESLLFRLHT